MMLTVTLGQGFLLGILGLGIFMTYRILNFPDMTAEGSFPLGGAVTVTLLTHQISPILATIAGMLGGIFGGVSDRSTLYKRKNTCCFIGNFSDDGIEFSYVICDEAVEFNVIKSKALE